MTGDRRAHLYARLRRSAAPATVPGTLPVLFFGDLFAAEVATVGLNPSDQEYLSKDGLMLTGAAQRFATLKSLGARDRPTLTDAQCHEAVDRMRGYYDEGKPVYGSWFKALSRVVDGFGASFRDRSAVHLDLVQEATSPVWSELPAGEREALLTQDLPFLEWEIRSFPLKAVICTAKTVSTHVRRQLGVVIDEEGTLARIKWWVGHADVDGRDVGFAGWNYPLARATGLGAAGERELGELLATKLGLKSGSVPGAVQAVPGTASATSAGACLPVSTSTNTATRERTPPGGDSLPAAAATRRRLSAGSAPVDLFALVDERRDEVRHYLEWAKANDNEQWTFRMHARPDIARAAEAARLFPEDWWGVVVYSCFDSTIGTATVAPYFQESLPPDHAEALLAGLEFPRRSVGGHRIQPAVTGAKCALVSACANAGLFRDVLHSGEDFDTRYRLLRGASMRQWGRTTCFDLLLRAGALAIGGQRYKPDYAYLGGSTGPKAGFACVWGVTLTDDASVAWAEGLLRAWADEWQLIAERVGVEWEKPPLEPCDQENFLCIYQERR